MKVVNANRIPAKESHSPLFIGGVVTLQPLVTPAMSKAFGMALVNFGKGARNKLHAHANDQVVIVTAGRGIVATEAEQRVVEVGDIVHFPAGEKHWHGATEDSDFSHIAIGVPGTETTQVED